MREDSSQEKMKVEQRKARSEGDSDGQETSSQRVKAAGWTMGGGGGGLVDEAVDVVCSGE